MVMREALPLEDANALVPWWVSARIGELVVELSKKHRFDLRRPGYILWVKAPEALTPKTDQNEWGKQFQSDLAICVNSEGYILGLSTPDGAGFRVHYSHDWVPLRAFNDNGCPFRNLASANEQMYKLVSRYRYSNRSQVTDEFWVSNAPPSGS